MKTRKQGDEIVLPVPSKFNIKADQEYVAVEGELGSITYIPKMKNIFNEALANKEDLRFEDDFEEDTQLKGGEEI